MESQQTTQEDFTPPEIFQPAPLIRTPVAPGQTGMMRIDNYGSLARLTITNPAPNANISRTNSQESEVSTVILGDSFTNSIASNEHSS